MCVCLSIYAILITNRVDTEQGVEARAREIIPAEVRRCGTVCSIRVSVVVGVAVPCAGGGGVPLGAVPALSWFGVASRARTLGGLRICIVYMYHRRGLSPGGMHVCSM